MSLTLYGAPLSPFVRKVRLLLAEKGLEYQLEMISPFDMPEWYRQINPLGRIPALRDGELTLADSGVICQYLDEKQPEPSFYGEGAEQRAQMRWLEKYADYELAPLATFVVFRNRLVKPAFMSQPCDENAVQSALNERLPPHFDYLQLQLGDKAFFLGDNPGIADLAVACQLINMEHGGASLDPARWPRLQAWLERIKARDSMQSMLPGELRMIAKLTTRA
jgi:glutathione S-transferase